MIVYTTREEWLHAALAPLSEMIREAGGPDFKTPFLSIGFPRGSRKAIGQAWTHADGYHIFIHPMMDDVQQVLATLLHELIHASVGNGAGHKGPFYKVAKGVGLVGKMTATTAGDELKERLNALATELGAFPHRPLNPAGAPKKQSSRMLKYTCPGCGQILRAASSDLSCACMECSEGMDEPMLFVMEA